MRPTSIGASSDFGVEDVHAVVSGHDPALTRVEAQGDWLRIDLGRSARDGHAGGIAQTIYLCRIGAPTADGVRQARTLRELREELGRLVVDEFKSADSAAAKRGARSEVVVRGKEMSARPDAGPDPERRKRRAAPMVAPVER